MANQTQEQPNNDTQAAAALNLDLAQPDRFQKSAGAGLDYLRDRRGPLFGLGLLIIIGAVGYILISWLFSNSREKAGDQLSWISDAAARPLDKEGAIIPEKKTGRAPLPRFTTEEAKQAGLLKEWQSFQTKYSGDAIATAQMGEASVMFDQGNYAGAAGILEKVINSADTAPALLAVARENLAYALEAQGNIDGAIAAFQVLFRDDPKGFYADAGRLHVARLLEKKGDKDKAIEEYKNIIKDFPIGGPSQDAEKRLRALGVEPPAKELPKLPALE